MVIGIAAAFLMVPAYALAGAWSSTGVLGDWLSLSPADAAGSPGRTLFAVAWIHAVNKMPIVILCLTIAMQRLDKSLLEQSLLDRSWMQTVRVILLPLLFPWLLFAWLACSMLIHSDMVISNLYQFETLTEHVYKNQSLDIRDPRSVVACIVFAVVLATSTSYVGIRCIANSRQSQSGRQTWWLLPEPSRSIRVIAGFVAILLLILFVFAPLSSLVYKSGFHFTGEPSNSGRGHATFSFARSCYSIIQAPIDFRHEAIWSLQLATWTTLVSIVIGLLMILSSWNRRLVSLVTIIVALTMLATPGPLINQLTTWLFNRNGPWFDTLYSDTLIPCIFGLQFRTLPIALLILWPAIHSMRRKYEDSWQIDFLSHWQWFCKGFLPVIWRPLIVAAVVSMMVAVGDLSSYLLVMPPGVTTLAMRIFDLLHYAVRYRDAGLLVFMTLLSTGLSFWVMRRFVI